MPIQVEHEGQTLTVYTEDEVKARIDEEVAGLKVTNQNLKAEKQELADKLRSVDEEKQRAEEEKAKRDGDYEKLQRLMDERLEAERKQHQTLMSQIRSEKVGNALNDIVTQVGAGGTRNEDLRDLLKARFEFDYDNETGQVKVAGDGITSLEELKKAITESGRYDAYLAGSKASGGGAPGSQGAGALRKWGDYSESERAQLAASDPDAFQRLLQTR